MNILKKAGTFEVIWASHFKQSLELELLKAFIARQSPNTNNAITCYGELGISLWDIFNLTWLPIVGKMCDEFFLDNKLIIDQRLPKSMQELFQIWGNSYLGNLDPILPSWLTS